MPLNGNGFETLGVWGKTPFFLNRRIGMTKATPLTLKVSLAKHGYQYGKYCTLRLAARVFCLSCGLSFNSTYRN